MKQTLIIIGLFLATSFGYAHQGRTDAAGGHHVTATGEYHIHCNPNNVDSYGGHIYIAGCYHYHPIPKPEFESTPSSRIGGMMGINIQYRMYCINKWTESHKKAALENNAQICAYLARAYNLALAKYKRLPSNATKNVRDEALAELNEAAGEFNNFKTKVGAANMTSTNSSFSVATPKK